MTTGASPPRHARVRARARASQPALRPTPRAPPTGAGCRRARRSRSTAARGGTPPASPCRRAEPPAAAAAAAAPRPAAARPLLLLRAAPLEDALVAAAGILLRVGLRPGQLPEQDVVGELVPVHGAVGVGVDFHEEVVERLAVRQRGAQRLDALERLHELALVQRARAICSSTRSLGGLSRNIGRRDPSSTSGRGAHRRRRRRRPP
eukprot:scaffold370_cov289-Prasinococcus_capsulatus_cf.AAC.10